LPHTNENDRVRPAVSSAAGRPVAATRRAWARTGAVAGDGAVPGAVAPARAPRRGGVHGDEAGLAGAKARGVDAGHGPVEAAARLFRARVCNGTARGVERDRPRSAGTATSAGAENRQKSPRRRRTVADAGVGRPAAGRQAATLQVAKRMRAVKALRHRDVVLQRRVPPRVTVDDGVADDCMIQRRPRPVAAPHRTRQRRYSPYHAARRAR